MLVNIQLAEYCFNYVKALAFTGLTSIFLLCLVQEEIKITGVTIFVNPYTEPDEEEEEAKAEEKAEDEDKVCY